ncbi:RAMP superfamily CRISPR-associated protein [Ectothiorhodospira mobilis]|uniref:RAMP superfamily CRISPR-associated protein n=1 Tax=Ectothiorhodospira mobilis TaxID=195064 RepID=UPI001EE81BF6|nr:RAMP superfamily CRISPR-associated protein [Ectothiorhodospira mobilis]MCG5536617.1 RAMP superfamily CRISPR-associated protein [Ectothiorhodospira mobilis]
MNPMREPVIHLARVVLEAATPLSVTTGQPDGVLDTALVTDANGLPALPGTSLAGVLRHLWQAEYGEDSAKALFGYQEGDEGTPSRVSVSWGALVDSRGQPAEGLLLGADRKRLQEDDVLRAAAELPVIRERVSLSEGGAAVDTGKFDRTILPAGHRFALELTLAGGTDEEWQQLLGLLEHPGLRAGGATRAGLGRLQRVTCHAGTFDREDREQAAAFLALRRGLADTEGLSEQQPAVQTGDAWLTATLQLEPEGPWRIGQGEPDPEANEEKPADLLPVTEGRIRWDGGTGRVEERSLLFPASSLKGALAHRFVFHAHCLAGRWAEDETATEAPEKTALFGSVKQDTEGNAESGRAGCLTLDDAWVEAEPERLRVMHNAIDRFTGGVRDRVLFEEEDLLGGEVRLRLALDRRRLEQYAAELDMDTDTIRQALSRALSDLCEGRLALGSRTTIGNGIFRGRLKGPLGQWLDGEQRTTEAA